MAAGGRQKILVVESSATRGGALCLILREIGHYEVIHAATVAEAMQYVKMDLFDLIATNTSVERVNDGIKLAQILLLRRLTTKPPTIVMVTPQRDVRLVREARRVGVVDYILYPYDPEDLLKRVGRVLTQRSGMSGDAIKKRITETLKQILQLPTISPVYNHLNAMMEDKDVAMDDLAAIIEYDPSISAKVLQLSNSAQYAQQKRITSVRDAIALLGLDQVGALVSAVTTFEAIGRIEESPNFERLKFWQHSMATGAIARVLARKLDMDEGQAFSAGILHDVGKVIMDGFFPEFFARALETAAKQDIQIHEAERHELPITHEVAGRYLAQQWGLPAPLVDAVGGHHTLTSKEPSHMPLINLTHVADAFCRLFKVGFPGDTKTRVLKAEVLDELKLKQKALARWTPEMKEEIAHALEWLKLL